jgi:toxin ParE1/3/4
MGDYRLTKDAQADLIRIHQQGVSLHGEIQADEYYSAFFDRFERLAGVGQRAEVRDSSVFYCRLKQL